MNRNRRLKFVFSCGALLGSLLFLLILGGFGHVTAEETAGLEVETLLPQVQTRSSSWITVHSPFRQDANANNHSTFEYSTSSGGPWTQGCAPGTGGERLWRYCTLGGLAANTNYYIRVTFYDPDGVIGPNPQVVGPVQTDSLANNAAVIRTARVSMQNTYMAVMLPVGSDANMNSASTVDIATSPGGPWTEKCGPSSFNPKLCRIHSLTPGTDYWIRVIVSDPDGVSGPNPQVRGPFLYTGEANLALGKAITADAGFGCCASPSHLVDGRIQNPAWFYGFAWCGGTSNFCGVGSGWKQATIDLGSVQSVNRVDWWTHDPNNVPSAWKVEVSTDGVNFAEVFSTTEPRCRTATTQFDLSWGFPSCGHSATFATTAARYVRYSFDDATLFGGIHGWAVEIEVFGP